MASTTVVCKINGGGHGISMINRRRLSANVHSSSVSSRHAIGLFQGTNIAQTKTAIITSSSRTKLQDHHRRGLVIRLAAAEYSNFPTADEAVKRDSVSTSDNNFNGAVTAKQGEELSRATLIWRAAKLPMYTVALIPVTVASAAAYWQTGIFYWGRYFGMLASYVIVNAWVNLSNDVYDFDTGADKDKKESVVNLFGSRNAINIIAWSLLAIGFAGFSTIALAAKNTRSLVFLVNACFCFFLYQCPPFRLSYYGVGEPLLFLAYGPLSTLGFYLLNSGAKELPITSTITWASVLVGLTTSLILFCSHFHQIEGDKAVGKMSPLVRLGTEMGSHVVKWSIIGLYFVLFALGYTKAIPFASAVFGAMTVPMGNLVVDFVQKNHKDKAKIFMGKYFCVRLHTIFGAALAAGFVFSRLLAEQVPQAI